MPMAVITLSSVPQPTLWHDLPSVLLSDETLIQRKAKVLSRMAQQGRKRSPRKIIPSTMFTSGLIK
jgi:hypothetical protein